MAPWSLSAFWHTTARFEGRAFGQETTSPYLVKRHRHLHCVSETAQRYATIWSLDEIRSVIDTCPEIVKDGGKRQRPATEPREILHRFEDDPHPNRIAVLRNDSQWLGKVERALHTLGLDIETQRCTDVRLCGRRMGRTPAAPCSEVICRTAPVMRRVRAQGNGRSMAPRDSIQSPGVCTDLEGSLQRRQRLRMQRRADRARAAICRDRPSCSNGGLPAETSGQQQPLVARNGRGVTTGEPIEPGKGQGPESTFRMQCRQRGAHTVLLTRGRYVDVCIVGPRRRSARHQL